VSRSGDKLTKAFELGSDRVGVALHSKSSAPRHHGQTPSIKLFTERDTGLLRATALGVPEGMAALAEARIAAAMDAGAFDGLPGRGAPLRFEDDSLIDPEWRIAFRLLKKAGMAPAWIEERKEILRERDLARSGLAVAPADSLGRAEAERRFSVLAGPLNRRITLLNLIVPGPRWALAAIDIKQEICRRGAIAEPAAAA